VVEGRFFVYAFMRLIVWGLVGLAVWFSLKPYRIHRKSITPNLTVKPFYIEIIQSIRNFGGYLLL
jgi:hypothetical protein